jgi:uncharacterized protein (DUF2062 family)
MVFRRRMPKSWAWMAREWIWPRAGWRRTAVYVLHRLRRLPGGTAAAAAGFACGAAVSFTPLNGLHFLIAALLAWLMRASVLASAIGTIVGNPWTFPPIWFGTYKLGRLLLGFPDSSAHVDFRAVFAALWYGVEHLDLAHLAERVWPVWWPMFVGSLPTAVVAWFAFYWLAKRGMIGYHRRHGLKRLERLAAGARRADRDTKETEE